METLLTFFMDWVKILVPFGLGIVVGIVVRRWEVIAMQPKLTINDVVVTAGFNLKDREGNNKYFFANRIPVLNTGRSGAKDCKVYIDFGYLDFKGETHSRIQRTGWMLPDVNTALSVTINVNIPEFIDLCAISEDGHYLVVTNEHGFRGGTMESCISLPLGGQFHATLTVASSNAQPAVRRIIIHGERRYSPEHPDEYISLSNPIIELL